MATYNVGDDAKALRYIDGKGTCLLPVTVVAVEKVTDGRTSGQRVTFEYSDGERRTLEGQGLRDFAISAAESAAIAAIRGGR
jgi:hypothetical protein